MKRPYFSERGISQAKAAVRNERGIALIMALLTLFLMSILGTILLTSSGSEVEISRNYRVRHDAFYAAERAVEYAIGDSNIYSTIGTGSVNIPLTGVSLQAGATNASGRVEYLSGGNPPRGSGVDITQFEANYYEIEATGTGPGNANAGLEVNVAKIVPKN